MKSLVKNFLIFFIIFLAIAALFSIYDSSSRKTERVGMEKFIAQIETQEIDSIIVKGSELEITLKDGTEEIVKKQTGDTLSELLDKNISQSVFKLPERK